MVVSKSHCCRRQKLVASQNQALTSFMGNKDVYGYPLPLLKTRGLSVMAIVGIGLGSGFLSLVLSFSVVCIWLRVTEQQDGVTAEQVLPVYYCTVNEEDMIGIEEEDADLGKVGRNETTGYSEKNINEAAVTKTNRKNGHDFGARTKTSTRIYEYPDPEFFHFEIDKREECFAVGQLWAV